MEQVKISDLQLADKVRFFEGAYETCTVKNVTADHVYLVRPFIHTSDYSHTGGVSTYIGLEDIKLEKCSERLVTRVEKGGKVK